MLGAHPAGVGRRSRHPWPIESNQLEPVAKSRSQIGKVAAAMANCMQAKHLSAPAAPFDRQLSPARQGKHCPGIGRAQCRQRRVGYHLRHPWLLKGIGPSVGW
jgi:hypothetical protein